MRDLRARMAIIGLILAFPVLMLALNPRRSSVQEAALPLLAVETILVGGLAVAARERLRLSNERAAAAAAGAVRSAPALRSPASSPHAVGRARLARGLPAGRL